MNHQTIDRVHVQGLIEKAKSKIEKFKKQIENIDAKIKRLKDDQECVEAYLEYLELSSRRKELLINGDRTEGEYGMPEDNSNEILNYYKDRCTNRKHRIQFHTNEKEKRQEGIIFMEHDIDLLNKAMKTNDKQLGLNYGTMDV